MSDGSMDLVYLYIHGYVNDSNKNHSAIHCQ